MPAEIEIEISHGDTLLTSAIALAETAG